MAVGGAREKEESGRTRRSGNPFREMVEFCFGKMDDAEWESVLSRCRACFADSSRETRGPQLE